MLQEKQRAFRKSIKETAGFMQKKIIRRPMSREGSVLQNVHPVLQPIYHARGITSVQELDHDLERLLPFETMLNIDKAVLHLYEALRLQKKILIVGDFDADGATSTAVAVRALKSFGAKEVHYLVPNRFTFGYGLTPELVEVAKPLNPKLIVTVDNGIANSPGVTAAKEAGIDVIITDHHLPGEKLPDADVIVNPNQPNDLFQSKCIAGVGVIFYVMLALRRYLKDQDWFTTQHITLPTMSRLLDLVALGTVADVVPLDQNNRILVHHGLRRIRAGQCVPGITALLEKATKNQSRLVAADLGFVVAPRLNAAGRLDDMSLGIECLLSDDLQKARASAHVLDQLNDERRVIEQDMQSQALHFLNKLEPESNSLPRGLCLFEEDWHQGVIGILASRIKDRLQRPVIAFARQNAQELKGSARSVPHIHIRDVLAQIATLHPELLSKFGGHAMAAGLTIADVALKPFAAIFNQLVSKQLTEADCEQRVLSDGELTPPDLTLELAEVLREAGPWGQAFSEPLFDGVFQLLEQRLVGSKHLKMTLGLETLILDAIAFNVDLKSWPNYRAHCVKIAYRLDVNEYRGKRKIQLIVEHLETA